MMKVPNAASADIFENSFGLLKHGKTKR